MLPLPLSPLISFSRSWSPLPKISPILSSVCLSLVFHFLLFVFGSVISLLSFLFFSLESFVSNSFFFRSWFVGWSVSIWKRSFIFSCVPLFYFIMRLCSCYLSCLLVVVDPLLYPLKHLAKKNLKWTKVSLLFFSLFLHLVHLIYFAFSVHSQHDLSNNTFFPSYLKNSSRAAFFFFILFGQIERAWSSYIHDVDLSSRPLVFSLYSHVFKHGPSHLISSAVQTVAVHLVPFFFFSFALAAHIVTWCGDFLHILYPPLHLNPIFSLFWLVTRANGRVSPTTRIWQLVNMPDLFPASAIADHQ